MRLIADGHSEETFRSPEVDQNVGAALGSGVSAMIRELMDGQDPMSASETLMQPLPHAGDIHATDGWRDSDIPADEQWLDAPAPYLDNCVTVHPVTPEAASTNQQPGSSIRQWPSQIRSRWTAVDRGNYLAANSFEEFPGLGLSTETIQAIGQIAARNLLVGERQDSLLLPAAYELRSGNLDAGAFLLAAHIELTQAGCLYPQPLIARIHGLPENDVPPSDLGERYGALWPGQPEMLAELRNLRQTYYYVPSARGQLTRRKLRFDNPGIVPGLGDGNEWLEETMRHRREESNDYFRRKKVSWWEEACLAVGRGHVGDPKYTTSLPTSSLHDESLATVWTGEPDITQLSLVLDVANPLEKLSLNRPTVSYARRLADRFDSEAVRLFDKHMYHRRASSNRLRGDATWAVNEYVKRTRGTDLSEYPLAAQFTVEMDRLDCLGFLPSELPQARPVNISRARRIGRLLHIDSPQIEYVEPGLVTRGREYAHIAEPTKAEREQRTVQIFL